MNGSASTASGMPERGRPVTGTMWIPLRAARAKTSLFFFVSLLSLVSNVPSRSRPIILIIAVSPLPPALPLQVSIYNYTMPVSNMI